MLWLPVALLLGALPPAPPTTLTATQQLARAIFKELIEIDTTADHGSTTLAAEAMAARLRAAGFSAADLFIGGPSPTKQNLVARLRAAPGSTRKPLLLLAHLDVVEAKREDWSTNPFSFEEKDGFFYGRGSTDDKAMAALWVATLVRLKSETSVAQNGRKAWAPDRDVILALTADEEGGPENGVEWLLANHRELIDAAYAINEGGGGGFKAWTPFLHTVQATEKLPVNFILKVTNKGGHSSVPVADNAITHLAGGLQRLAGFTFPVALNSVTRAYFEQTASIEKPELAQAMRALLKAPDNAEAAATLSRNPKYSAMLRTTCVATRLFGGHADNALPQLATANVNCRIMPNVPPEEVRAQLVTVLADPAIEVSAAPPFTPSAPSERNDELMKPVEQLTHELWPGIPVIPTMSTGATDGRFLRAQGIPTYGVSGLFGDLDDNRAHGRDERLLVKAFYDGQTFLDRLVRLLSSSAQSVRPLSR